MNRNDGGPAFPLAFQEDRGATAGTPHKHNGMTLRDYFAAKAMAALIPLAGSPPVPMAAAEMAYMVADEMLKRRDA